MSVSVDKYKADSNRLVGLLTPFFLRGKKVLKFLAAIASPLDDDNATFCSWAKERIVDAVSTSQPIVLKWCLDQKLQHWFKNPDDHFDISLYAETPRMILYEDKEEVEATSNAVKVYALENADDTTKISADHQAVITDEGEERKESDEIDIIAPQHIDSISDKEYERLIKQIVEYYLVYKVTYYVKIKK